MRPAVVTAVLLLAGIVNPGTALSFEEAGSLCPEKGDYCMGTRYWTSFGQGRCMKLFHYTKTFKDAQDWFKNMDGTEFNFTNWLPNQPDNYLGQEGCVEANAGGWGMWNDNRCSGRKIYLCAKKR